MNTLQVMQNLHGPEEKQPHQSVDVWSLRTQQRASPPPQNTLTFQTPEGAVLALMLFVKSHCQCSTHERRPKTFASKPT